MNREIKFRAWDEEYKRMWFSDFHYSNSLSHFFEEMKSSFILLQFTGLKDKNGKEIYEGDIVECPDYYQASALIKKEKVEVIFDDGMFMAKGFGRYYQKDLTTCRVIGNIYENPELLKE